ncbi:MAG: hypothetical protein UT48_C0014G0007 [Parcubacteria group bacterium GW2011_GWE2_39_37]|uniref:Fimbrial assembly family protein n=1 Tax=Candidatus Falkowbacteria bacterium GW2011_GWF2_39_8 TaxID=1618642 RepID=A0A0G0Q5G9_9BACT|nr:MAG: hypothetical protein UT48_C0014G0007 [Parcubacteria group bacterium GW2011_GWE2_39_37]KKR32586.1 MAG: hypothetical protein UT64_C0028G0002 [Candidatus Falkowbacteria bacterium GW2011_GWF2_39_8]
MDFISKKEEETKKEEIVPEVEWSRPELEKKTKSKIFDIFSFFKKGKKTEDKKEQLVEKMISRKETLDLIKNYVRHKEEIGEEKNDEIKKEKVSELNINNAAEEGKFADLPTAEKVKTEERVEPISGEAIDKKSWLRYIISKIKLKNHETKTIVATDLIKGEVITFFDWQKSFIYLVAATLISFLLIGFAYLILLYNIEIKKQNAQDFEKKLALINEKISKEEVGIREIDIFQQKIILVNSLINDHVYWTNFFKFLEENTLTDISFSSVFNGNAKGEYSFDATAKDFGAVVKQIEVLRNNKLVRSVSTNGGTVLRTDDAKEVNFDLKLSLDPTVFLKNR